VKAVNGADLLVILFGKVPYQKDRDRDRYDKTIPSYSVASDYPDDKVNDKKQPEFLDSPSCIYREDWYERIDYHPGNIDRLFWRIPDHILLSCRVII
jgi:hypothetical protein